MRLNFGIEGLVLPLSSAYNIEAVLRGIAKRMYPTELPIDMSLMRELRNFSRNQIRNNYSPLDLRDYWQNYLEYVTSWLSQTNYNGQRKKELMKCATWINENLSEVRNCIHEFVKGNKSKLSSKLFDVKSFVKNEFTATEKEARIINSRSDYFKVIMGPIAKMMEEKVYDLSNNLGKHFIKHVAVKERPHYLQEHVETPFSLYYATDYTSFENSFGVKQQLALEQQLYKWLLKDSPDLYDIFKVQLRSVNCRFRNVCVRPPVMRMSGEMTTSLGNGISNLLLFKFMMYKNGLDPESARGVVEGDDGLWSLPRNIDVSMAEKLGFRLKLVIHNSVNEASFCGQIFDTTNNVVLTDPYYAMASMGWAAKTGTWNEEKQAMVTACKALSMLYQYQGCPVIQALAECSYRNSGWTLGKEALIEKVKQSAMNSYIKDWYLETLHSEARGTGVANSTRALFEKLYNFPIAAQFELENLLKEQKGWMKTLYIHLPGFSPDWLNRWFDYQHPETTSLHGPFTVDTTGRVLLGLGAGKTALTRGKTLCSGGSTRLGGREAKK